MKTSARNILTCRVSAVMAGAVTAEAVLARDDALHWSRSSPTRASTTWGFEPGKEVHALVTSSFVILALPAVGRASARKVLAGTLARREDGAVNSEIPLDIGGGRTIAAPITKESARFLDFTVGDPACALIKASPIILAVD